MPWNGSGTYSLPAAYSPEVNGTIIDAVRYNGLTSDVASGITNALAKDGQNAPTANLPMGGFKHTGAAAANASGQYLIYGQSATMGTLTLDSGTAALPSLTFTGDTNTGIFRTGADGVGISTGGTSRFQVTNTALTSLVTHGFVTGSAAAPSITFSSDTGTNTGFFLSAENVIGVAANGAEVATFGNTYLRVLGATQGFIGVNSGSGATVNALADDIVIDGATNVGLSILGGTTNSGSIFFGDSANSAIGGVVYNHSTDTLQLRAGGDIDAVEISAGTLKVNAGAFGVFGVREAGAYGGAGPNSNVDGIVLEANGNTGISILTPNTATAQIRFGDSDSNTVGGFGYAHSTDLFTFTAGGITGLALTGDGRVYGSALHNNAGAVTGTTNQFIASGTYTPTLANVANSSARSVTGTFKWMRVGNVVLVEGVVSVTASGLGVVTISATLPPPAGTIAGTSDGSSFNMSETSGDSPFPNATQIGNTVHITISATGAGARIVRTLWMYEVL